MKVLVAFGTRPEAIKMCPLVIELKKKENISCKVCLTGQHKEMINPVMELFKVAPDYNLDIMRNEQSLSLITGSILSGIDGVFDRENPDMVLVHGDTSSSFTVALAAFYRHIPIGHVEAGLRTYDMQAPYPEEFNRQAVDLVSDLYFAPTQTARDNLLKEGKEDSGIFVTGNTVIDALNTTVADSYENEHIAWADGSRLLLLTAHRRENIGRPMRRIFRAIKRIVKENPDVKVIYPVHKNPKVREIANEILADTKQVRLIEPLDVYDFHNFMSRSYLILTDSGGIQEEAPALGKPVLVLRDATERPEGIAAGTLKLVGTDEDNIYFTVRNLLSDDAEYRKMSKAINPYGDGHASESIVNIILEYFRKVGKG